MRRVRTRDFTVTSTATNFFFSGCIVISRVRDDSVYMDIMKKFKEIIKDGSSAAYGAKGPHQIAGDRKSRYQKCSGAVINALGNIAAFIQVSF